MPIYNSLLESGLCVGYVESREPIESPLAVLSPSVQDAMNRIGALWIDGAWVAAPDPPPEPVSLDLFAFRERFTATEKLAIYTAAATDMQIRIWLDDLSALAQSGGRIRLDDPRTIAGVQSLEAAGILSEGRAVEVLG